MNQTQFPLSHNNYAARVFSELHSIPLNKLHYFRKKKEENYFWVCCIENEFVRGYEINEDRYFIWCEGGQKLKALIKYLKEQEKIYS